MPQVRKRIAKLFPDDATFDTNDPIYNIEEEDTPNIEKNELLNTIKVPQNLA